MDVPALVLLTVPLIGYAVVGGAGLGLGMVLPRLGRDAGERREVVRVMRPLLRAGWAWLGGLVLAASVWPGLRAVVAVVAVGEAVRFAAVTRWPSERVAYRLICGGSWLAAAGWGWGLGTPAVAGSARPEGGLLPAFTGAAVVLLLVAHGLAVGVRRLTGPPFGRARRLVGGGSRSALLPLTTAALGGLPPAAAWRLPAAERPVLGAGDASTAGSAVALAAGALLIAAVWARLRRRR